MSKIKVDHIFTSESVSEGHPDKVCDQISDGILDACLAAHPLSRVACETLTTTNLVVNAGEITVPGVNEAELKSAVPFEKVVREIVHDIGYDRDELKFSAKSFEYINRIRIQKACLMLKRGNLQITEIAFAVGYNNLSFFYRYFSKIMKMTPREYRAIAQK